MPALLSAENRIREHLARLNCTAGFLSQLAQIPASRLSEASRGVRPLSNDDAELLEGLLKELDALVEAFQPIPIQLTNPQQIRALLDDIKDRRLAEAFCVKVGERSWFYQRRGGKVLSSFSMLQGAAMTRLVAEKVAASLRANYPDEDIAVARNMFASPDSIATEFHDVWTE
jgi:hypothetical protein